MRGLDRAADGGGTDEVDAVEVGERLGKLFALFDAFGGEVRVGDGLIVVDVVVALGVADEVDGFWGHSSDGFVERDFVGKLGGRMISVCGV